MQLNDFFFTSPEEGGKRKVGENQLKTTISPPDWDAALSEVEEYRKASSEVKPGMADLWAAMQGLAKRIGDEPAVTKVAKDSMFVALMAASRVCEEKGQFPEERGVSGVRCEVNSMLFLESELRTAQAVVPYFLMLSQYLVEKYHLTGESALISRADTNVVSQIHEYVSGDGGSTISNKEHSVTVSNPYVQIPLVDAQKRIDRTLGFEEDPLLAKRMSRAAKHCKRWPKEQGEMNLARALISKDSSTKQIARAMSLAAASWKGFTRPTLWKIGKLPMKESYHALMGWSEPPGNIHRLLEKISERNKASVSDTLGIGWFGPRGFCSRALVKLVGEKGIIINTVFPGECSESVKKLFAGSRIDSFQLLGLKYRGLSGKEKYLLSKSDWQVLEDEKRRRLRTEPGRPRENVSGPRPDRHSSAAWTQMTPFQNFADIDKQWNSDNDGSDSDGILYPTKAGVPGWSEASGSELSDGEEKRDYHRERIKIIDPDEKSDSDRELKAESLLLGALGLGTEPPGKKPEEEAPKQEPEELKKEPEEESQSGLSALKQRQREYRKEKKKGKPVKLGKSELSDLSGSESEEQGESDSSVSQEEKDIQSAIDGSKHSGEGMKEARQAITDSLTKDPYSWKTVKGEVGALSLEQDKEGVWRSPGTERHLSKGSPFVFMVEQNKIGKAGTRQIPMRLREGHLRADGQNLEKYEWLISEGRLVLRHSEASYRSEHFWALPWIYGRIQERKGSWESLEDDRKKLWKEKGVSLLGVPGGTYILHEGRAEKLKNSLTGEKEWREAVSTLLASDDPCGEFFRSEAQEWPSLVELSIHDGDYFLPIDLREGEVNACPLGSHTLFGWKEEIEKKEMTEEEKAPRDKAPDRDTGIT
jgi:hypothetical protein